MTPMSTIFICILSRNTAKSLFYITVYTSVIEISSQFTISNNILLFDIHTTFLALTTFSQLVLTCNKNKKYLQSHDMDNNDNNSVDG